MLQSLPVASGACPVQEEGAGGSRRHLCVILLPSISLLVVQLC